MNPEKPSREEIEAKLTALLLGELPAEEAQLLRWAISQDAATRQIARPAEAHRRVCARSRRQSGGGGSGADRAAQTFRWNAGKNCSRISRRLRRRNCAACRPETPGNVPAIRMAAAMRAGMLIAVLAASCQCCRRSPQDFQNGNPTASSVAQGAPVCGQYARAQNNLTIGSGVNDTQLAKTEGQPNMDEYEYRYLVEGGHVLPSEVRVLVRKRDGKIMPQNFDEQNKPGTESTPASTIPGSSTTLTWNGSGNKDGNRAGFAGGGGRGGGGGLGDSLRMPAVTTTPSGATSASLGEAATEFQFETNSAVIFSGTVALNDLNGDNSRFYREKVPDNISGSVPLLGDVPTVGNMFLTSPTNPGGDISTAFAPPASKDTFVGELANKDVAVLDGVNGYKNMENVNGNMPVSAANPLGQFPGNSTGQIIVNSAGEAAKEGSGNLAFNNASQNISQNGTAGNATVTVDPDTHQLVVVADAPVPQPEFLTSENAFSTFSLNVSDVSSQAREASLEKGVMPDAASIRSEEFINAFDYRDPEPRRACRWRSPRNARVIRSRTTATCSVFPSRPPPPDASRAVR
jgi:hypothetical protein